MATAPARPRSAGRPLIRRHVDWPPTPEKLYHAISLPRGFRKELSLGRLRIGHPGRGVDRQLLDLADRLAAELPGGCRLDVYAGQIVVGGFAVYAHYWAVAGLIRQLEPVAAARGWLNSPGTAVIIPHLREYIGPDVLVVRPDAPIFDEVPCGEGVPLAGEVTSPGNADRDHGKKRRFYGQAGVAIYLIVDLQRGEVLMHTRPHESGYLESATVRLGEPLALPEPFGITLDTGALLRPEST